MSKRMLIDATHSEETRVVVAEDNQLLEYDYETTTKKQLKGNIYLAKVTRVEPSLQAAFVDFGGNRHGFLAANDIHPDYYRIPIEDREKLLADSRSSGDGEDGDDEAGNNGESVETVGGDDSDDIQELGDAQRQSLRALTRQYKIQEVIKRRQILLVQVVKEERGNKGAALTTYLSLPGRYCVLMPNTSRGGGISRKISNPAHRKKLKSILSDLEVAEGMAVIMRTAGVERSKAEVRRDYEYLRRLWDEIRELTLRSTAPALIYEEGDVIKRALRDIYAREIEEVLIEGDDAYKSAKTLMRTMIPSHAKRVKRYIDGDIPLYHRYQIESQLDEIHEQEVTLRSGGYIVINPTEALVAIDVNSGRSTRERNIEQTALKTNLEAADEIARQLRLRDLAGLIVIDFIDMDVHRNNSAVERRLKEAMRHDRARIQVGRISPFGLLELSRQRLRPSLIEASSQVCATCGGSGHVRSTESAALRALRAIEEEGIRHRSREINVRVPTDVALYLLNQKRGALNRVETSYGLEVGVAADDTLVPPDFGLDAVRSDDAAPAEAAPAAAGEPARAEANRDGDDGTRRRRRRSRRRRDDEPATAAAAVSADDAADAAAAAGDAAPAEDAADATAEAEAATDGDGEGAAAPRRRRGRRGGRRRRRETDEATDASPALEAGEAASAEAADDPAAAAPADPTAADDAADSPPPRPRRRRRSTRLAAAAEDDGAPAPKPADGDDAAKPRAPARRRRTRRPTATATPPADAASTAQPADDDAPAAAEPIPEPTVEPPPAEPAPAELAADPGAAAPSSDGDAVDAAAQPESGPAPQRRRKGWWNPLTS